MLGVAALGLCLVGAGVGYVRWRENAPAAPEPGFDYGAHRGRVLALRSQLEKEPCDRTRGVEFAQTLFSLQDWRGSVRFTDDFIARCGRFPALRSISYSAHIRLSEFEPAIRDATELIDSAPANAGYRVWRALAYQSRGAAEESLVDFQEAFKLQPEQFQVANQLATTYEQRNQPCEAWRVLREHQRVSSQASHNPEIVGRAQGLALRGRCTPEETRPAVPAGKPRK
jgi:Flp pilus assembly protein TadD